MLGGGGCWACFRSGPISVGGGVGAAKGLLPYFLVPKGNQPTACTLALWWLKFGPTGGGGRALQTSKWLYKTMGVVGAGVFVLGIRQGKINSKRGS